MMMYLYILFADGRCEMKVIKMFSDLSHTKSSFYYYEEPADVPGKGTCINRDDIGCFVVSAFRRYDYEKSYNIKSPGD